MFGLNIAAFVLAVAAVLVFVLSAAGSQKRWIGTNLGLALAVSAWVAQATWQTEHLVHF